MPYSIYNTPDMAQDMDQEDTAKDLLLRIQQDIRPARVHVLFTSSDCTTCKIAKGNIGQRWNVEIDQESKQDPLILSNRHATRYGKVDAVLILTDWHEDDLNKYNITYYPTCLTFREGDSLAVETKDAHTITYRYLTTGMKVYQK